MAPWSCWSEWATGTNGMGTALEAPGAVLISGPEHWCTGFDEWVCAGVAVRDPVTDDAGRGARRVDLAEPTFLRRRPDGCPRRWAARARSCASTPATAAPSWQRRSPRPARGPDRDSLPWTHAARSSSPTTRRASSSASPRGCPRWTRRCAGNPALDLGRLARHAIEAGPRRPRLGRLDADRDASLTSEPCRITLRPVFLADQADRGARAVRRRKR